MFLRITTIIQSISPHPSPMQCFRCWNDNAGAELTLIATIICNYWTCTDKKLSQMHWGKFHNAATIVIIGNLKSFILQSRRKSVGKRSQWPWMLGICNLSFVLIVFQILRTLLCFLENHLTMWTCLRKKSLILWITA